MASSNKTYFFRSMGRDSASNIEAAPGRSSDVVVEATFSNTRLQATGIDVQRGAQQRSYIRYLDVLVSTETGLASLLDAGRVKVERFALDATNVTAESGTVVTNFNIDRILGDANGDAKVDDADLAVVISQSGQSDANLEGDMDGNGGVNAFDRNYVNNQKAINRQLDDALKQLLDD